MNAGVPSDQITVIPNGVNAAQFSPGDQKAAREAIGYSDARPLVVSVGNLKPVKGHDVLIRAVAHVAKQYEIRLVCIGGGVQSSWGRELQKLVRHLGIEDGVRFIGSKQPDEVVHWLRAADLFSLASHREGCCNAVLESLAAGTPVVVTDAGDNRTMVQSPECGTVVPTNDHEQLAKAIIQWLTKESDRNSISQSVRSFDWSNVGSKVVQLFCSRCGVSQPKLTSVIR
jgi:glycosyltransferase involved in cell wall biosynthesis